MTRPDLLVSHTPPSFTAKQVSAFWSRVVVGDTDACWLWTGSVSGTGYGRLSMYFDGQKRQMQAHRVSWFLDGKSIPSGHEIDHACDCPPCVNPNHLRAVTPAQNSRRSRGMGGIHAAQTHCKYGHEFNATNTRHYKHPSGRTLRHCRPCYQRQKREARERARA